MSMNEKIPISQLIEGLRGAGVYDVFTQRKLNVLATTFQGAAEIAQKERLVIEQLFGELMEKVERRKEIEFWELTGTPRRGQRVIASVKDFLGFGNAGPVFSVIVHDQPYALKAYWARELRDMISLHGKFGLAGILYQDEHEDRPTGLSDLGQTVLARKSKGIYGRSRRIVKIHKVGEEKELLFLLMDLLAVDPLVGHIDPAKLGGNLADLVSWSVDCIVGLCHLHTEERRLHLNIRPEAFIRNVIKAGDRQPKFTFFHYPKTFYRPADGSSAKTEFIMVDHLDSSVDMGDPAPKGLASVGSWVFLPPEHILNLLQTLRNDYQKYVKSGTPIDAEHTIKFRRTQLDDIWALGVTLYQFLSGGKFPFGEPRNLAEMVNAVLLTKFDFSPIDWRLQSLLSAMLEKEPKKRYQRILEGCPDKIRDKSLLAEAILYKLEQVALGLAPGE
jgi:serine/threonine protein kinase